MKRTILAIALGIALVLLITSCGDDMFYFTKEKTETTQK